MYRPGGVASEVALKVLASDVGAETDPVHRLRDEGRLLGALNHPGLLKVFDLVSLEGRVALVTEYVEGQDLHQAIYQGDLPVKVLVEIVGQVAESLHAAWTTRSPTAGAQLRLVHRDIKPQNVRLGVHGEVKLLDFGIARALNDLERESHTKNDIMMGSWPYLAPERMLEQPAELSSAVDVYGLGCVLFEGLAGQRLMEGQSLFGLYRVVDVPGAFDQLVQARVQTLDAAIPGELRGFLHRLLAEDPSERPSAYQTGCLCDELAERLPGPGLRRWARERRWPAHSKEPGPLTGRDLAESTFPIEDAPTVRRPLPAPPRTAAARPVPPPSLPMPAAPAPAPPTPQPQFVRPGPSAPTPAPAPANRRVQTRWTPMTRPRTPSLPPSLEGWMPPVESTPEPAGQPRIRGPASDAGAFVIDESGRRGAPPPPAPREPRGEGSALATVGLFAIGFALFVGAGAGTWFIIQAQEPPEGPAAGLTPATIAATQVPDTPTPGAPVEPLVREEVAVEDPPEARAGPSVAERAGARTVDELDEPEPASAPEAPADEVPPPPELEPLEPPDAEAGDEPAPVASAEPPPRILDSRGASAGGAIEALPTEPPPELAAEPLGLPDPADEVPGVLVVQGDAVVELRGDFGSFRAGTPLLPGSYEVWADVGAGLAATGLRTRLGSGGTVTVSCSVKAARCFVSPRLE